MTPAFTDEQKAAIRAKLISSGTELAKTSGLKKMTVAAAAAAAGIGVGTFYKFFTSKESFVTELIKNFETKAYARITAAFTDGSIALSDFIPVYREYFRPESNFFLYMRPEDMLWCKAHLGDQFTAAAYAQERTEQLLPHISGVRRDADMRVVMNFIKAIYSMYQNRDTAFEDVMQINVDLIFETIYNYLKEE